LCETRTDYTPKPAKTARKRHGSVDRRNEEKPERIKIKKLTSDLSTGPTKSSRKRRQEKSCKAKSDEPQDQVFLSLKN
jgi:hypothetical protein